MKRFVVPILLIQSELVVAATTYTWISTSSSSMNSPANWAPPGGPPVSETSVMNFPPTSTLQFSVVNDIGSFVLLPTTVTDPNSLTISATATTGYSISPMLSNDFKVSTMGSATAKITFGSSAVPNILSVPIDLNGGTLNLIGGAAFDQLTGGITGAGTLLTVTGGMVQISGTNTYTAPTTIASGTLRLGSAGALPSGTAFTVSTGGNFELNNFSQTFTSSFTMDTGSNAYTGTGTLTVSNPSVSGNIAINSGGTLKIINSGSNTFAGNLVTDTGSGTGGTFELGATSTGTVTVTGANSYSTQTRIGNTTVTAGTLRAGNASAFGTLSNVSIASGATLDLNSNSMNFNSLTGAGNFTLGTATAVVNSGLGDATFSGMLTGTGSGQFNYAGTNKLTLSGTSNSLPSLVVSGGGTLNVASLTNINALIFEGMTSTGTLQFSTGMTGTTPITISSSNANIDTLANTVTLNGAISGAGGDLTKVGSGSLTLGGSNSYNGTIVSAGTVLISGSSSFPTGKNLTISGGATFNMQGNAINVGALSGAGTLTMGSGNLTVSVGSSVFSGAINGTGNLIYSGNGNTFTLSGTNGYTGTTSITGTGTLVVSQSAFNTTTGLTFSGSGGTLEASSVLTNSIPITLSAAGTISIPAMTTSTFSGQITGSSTLTKQGDGTLVLHNPGGMTASDYTGQTNVFAGTLRADNAGAFGVTPIIRVKTDATLDLNGFNLGLDQLLGDFDSSVLLGGATLTIAEGSFTNPYYGVISEMGNLTLTGGSPSFMGTNTYSGTTTIQGGALFNILNLDSISGTMVFGTGGGTLTIGSTTSTGADFTLNSDAGKTSTISTNTFDLTVTGKITGNGQQFVKLGSGTLYLNPGMDNDFSSTPLSIQGGTLKVTAAGLGGASDQPSTITFQNFCGTLQADEDLTITSPITVSSTGKVDTNGHAVSISSNITDPAPTSGLPKGGLAKLGAGTLTLTGTNTYSAPTTISGGTLVAGASSLPLPSMTFVPTVVFSTANSLTGTFRASSAFPAMPGFPTVILNASGTFDTNGFDMHLTQVIAGASGSSLIKTGAGTLYLAAENLYTGNTVIQNGTVNLAANNTLQSTSTIQFSGAGGGILQAGNATLTIANPVSLTQNGSIDSNGNTFTISGVISSSSSAQTLTKTGMGTLILSGLNTYTGPTTVSQGTLQAGVATGNSGAFGVNSAVTVANGATLNFSTFANSVASINNSGTLQSSAGVTTSTFTQTSMGAAALNFPTSSASPVGNVAATGAIALDGSLTVTSTGGYAGGTNVILFQSSGSGKQLMGSFSSVTVPFGSIHYDYSANQVILGSGGGGACDATWVATGMTEDWDVMGNWMSTGSPCVPGVSGNNNDSAMLPNVAPMTVAITLPTSGITLQYLDFDASMTDYTIQQNMGMGSITMDDTQPTTPNIHVIAGDHTINAPIVLNQQARLMLSSGSLTLGPAATITSSMATWSLSEGSGTGTLINNGTMTPSSLLIEGNTVDNNLTIQPTGSLAISGLGGGSGVTVNNHQTLGSGTTITLGNSAGASTLVNDAGKTVSSGGAFTIGGGGGAATLTNNGTVTSGSTLTINSGTVANNSGASISSTGALTIAGGAVTNSLGADFGSSSADLIFSGGTLTSSDEFLANDYTQGSSAALTLIFPMNAPSPVGHLSATGGISLNGSLTVPAGMYMGGTNVVLLESSGSGKQLQGTFSSVSVPFGTLRYDYSENQVILASGGTCDGTWNQAGDGNWNVMGNWTSCVPGTMGNMNDSATFPTVGASDVAITLPAAGVTLQYLDFDSEDTSYTIVQSGGMGSITLNDTQPTKPTLHVISGTHTINAPIVLSQESRFMISSGSLTLGAACTVTSAGTWNLSEGSGSGVLNNNGTISPTDLLIEGNTVNNDGSISPTGAISLSGLGGIGNTAIVNNNAMGSIVSGTTFAIGAAGGPTTVNNAGTMTSTTTFTIGTGSGSTTLNNTAAVTAGTTFTIAGGTVNNNTGGSLLAASGSAFTISGGSIANNTGGTIGSSTSDLVFSGGALATFGHVLADNYTQSGSATLQTHVASLTEFGDVAASGTGNLGGNLIVYADPGISLVHGNTVNLLTATGGRNAQFSTVSFQNFPPSLIPSIVYLDNAVQLDIRASNPNPTQGGTQSVVFTAIGQHNSFLTLQMMHMRDRMSQPAPEVAGRYLPYSVDELLAENEEVLIVIEPEVIAQQPGIIQKTEQLTQRVEREAFPWSVYAGPVASFGHVESRGDQLGLGYASAGGLAGFDRIIDDEEMRPYRAGVGAICEYRKIWGTVNSNGGSNSIDRVHGSVYATAVPKSIPNLAVEAILGFAFNWDDLVRTTGINQSLTTRGSTTETIGNALLGFEYSLSGKQRSWLPCNFTVVPFFIWQYVVDYVAAYTESGAGIYDLHYDSMTPSSLTSLLGSRFQYLFRGASADLRLEIDAGWQYEYLDRSLAVTATAFNITALPVTGTTVSPGRNSLILALDLLGLYNGGWTVELNTTYTLNSLFYDLYFYAGFGREF